MRLTAVWAVKRKHRAMAAKAVRLCMQVPVQVASAVLMLLSAGWAEARLNAADIWAVTALFFFLVLLAATQDIAVDGWALTLLSRHNIGCETSLQQLDQLSSCLLPAWLMHAWKACHVSVHQVYHSKQVSET